MDSLLTLRDIYIYICLWSCLPPQTLTFFGAQRLFGVLNGLPAKEMLNLISFGGTAEMLNMLNFWGVLELIGKITFPKPQNFNMYHVSAVSLTFFSPKPTKFNITAVGVKQ